MPSTQTGESAALFPTPCEVRLPEEDRSPMRRCLCLRTSLTHVSQAYATGEGTDATRLSSQGVGFHQLAIPQPRGERGGGPPQRSTPLGPPSCGSRVLAARSAARIRARNGRRPRSGLRRRAALARAAKNTWTCIRHGLSSALGKQAEDEDKIGTPNLPTKIIPAKIA